MKSFIAFALSVFMLVSCKDKLPANIKSQVNYTKLQAKYVNESDSILLSLTDKDIENMPLDTLSKICRYRIMNYGDWRKADDELQDLLKYNAKYSDYAEVKNIYPNCFTPEFIDKLDAKVKSIRRIKDIKRWSLKTADSPNTEIDWNKRTLDGYLMSISTTSE